MKGVRSLWRRWHGQACRGLGSRGAHRDLSWLGRPTKEYRPTMRIVKRAMTAGGRPPYPPVRSATLHPPAIRISLHPDIAALQLEQAPLAQAVEEDGEENDSGQHHRLQIEVDLDEDHAGLHDLHEHCADDG